MSQNLKKHQYYIFFKPYGALSQFTGPDGKDNISNYGPFPGDIYPVGRLDADSEGLILLTNDNFLKHRLLDPANGHPRTYLAQVERIPDERALQRLRDGVLIEGRKTLPAKIELLENEPDIAPRPVPVRFRKNVPTCWLKIVLTEGRNRQVRKMTALVGHPTLRLLRVGIGTVSIEGLNPGDKRMLGPGEVDEILNLVKKEIPG